MTKENKIETETIETIETMLQQWETLKQQKKISNDFFKTENKIAFIDKINQRAINLLIKDNNKIGFQKIFATDIFKIFLKKFYESNGVFFNAESDGKVYYLLKDNDKSRLLSCVDYKTYAFNVLEENKKKAKEKQEKLAKKKTGVKLAGLDVETLQAVILQAKQQLKETTTKNN